MVLPIYAYGDSVLKKVGKEIDPEFPGLTELIENMYETMYRASGVGLAAPQIGMSIRLFIVDTRPLLEDEEEENKEEPLNEVFINAEILSSAGEPWSFTEGCLSIPGIRENVMRQSDITMRYQNEKFETIEKTFTGVSARVIQHEYDHIDGKLFTDYLKPLKRRMLKKKLEKISKGEIEISYKMKFPNRSPKKR